MTTINVTKAHPELYKLLEQVAEGSEPIRIHSKRGSAVLIAEDEWRSIQETLHLLAIPRMRESIIKGLKTPVEECAGGLDW
ncbi:MAG: type II toxin-antitoxin system Phd/YefM family antitoxin [Gemmatimonadota bacterium]|nr:type II toxin-antitoxin system Phd/YefM family antitoxin [Gemmatimonadota bacterium]